MVLIKARTSLSAMSPFNNSPQQTSSQPHTHSQKFQSSLKMMSTMQYPVMSRAPSMSRQRSSSALHRARSSSMSYQPRPVSGYGNTPHDDFRQSQIYTPGPNYHHRMQSYDDLTIPYTHHSNGSGYFPQYNAIQTIPVTPGRPSPHHRRSSMQLSRRASQASPDFMAGHHRSHSMSQRTPGSLRVKFKRRGSIRDGVMLDECMMKDTVSEKKYRAHDLHSEIPLTITIYVQWAGYQALRYRLTVDEKSGKIRMQTLARRIARSCVDYFTRFRVPVRWQDVALCYLEETNYGTWRVIMTHTETY